MNDDNDNNEPRLGLYVPAKGYIPIDEDPFDESYDGIRVDVREAVYERFRKYAKDVHTHVKMGCQIERKRKTGTLGLFVQHPFYGLCGVTCAHVLLDDEEKKAYNNKKFLDPEDPENFVHQPSPPHDIGVIRKVIVKEDARYPIGVEIAVIQIKKRGPNSGQFPAPRQPQPHGNGTHLNTLPYNI
ncbi:hypothetical protein DPMN_181259 [Dreissena polymorpha]|uniref:Uncharacterized protein n=1 Tax=Dreissena polymorpha TaxID=45954 RepID=A0A9D4DEY2_DREPO|nr:hypothetical protein DPMN_181259 [Dreissena polymorpha]